MTKEDLLEIIRLATLDACSKLDGHDVASVAARLAAASFGKAMIDAIEIVGDVDDQSS